METLQELAEMFAALSPEQQEALVRFAETLAAGPVDKTPRI